jgi:hypothetical protein
MFSDTRDVTFDTLDEAWNRAGKEVRAKFLEIVGLLDTWENKERKILSPDPDPPPPPASAPPPTPPAPEKERISPRTAAFLAEIRKQVFKGEAA